MSAMTIGADSGVLQYPLLADGIRFALSESTVAGIVICVILLIISSFTWTVMVTKFRMVSRVHKASARFLSVFRSSKDPLSAYFNQVKAENAPIFKVYQSGSLHNLEFLQRFQENWRFFGFR